VHPLGAALVAGPGRRAPGPKWMKSAVDGRRKRACEVYALFRTATVQGVLWLPPDVGLLMRTRRPILMILILVGCVSVLACATVREDRKIAFVYRARGASGATGVGALPLTEGYVFLIKRELDKRVPGVALVNLGVPGARVDLIRQQGGGRA